MIIQRIPIEAMLPGQERTIHVPLEASVNGEYLRRVEMAGEAAPTIENVQHSAHGVAVTVKAYFPSPGGEIVCKAWEAGD